MAPPCGRVLDPTDRALAITERRDGEHPFFTPPVSTASRFDPQSFFRVLLLRRLWCQLPFCNWPVGQPLDSRGHPGACGHVGVVGRRGFLLESCAARICREAGARVSRPGSPSRAESGQLPSGSGRRRFASLHQRSLPWTPRWSAQCELTEPRGSAQNGMEPPRTKHERTHVPGTNRWTSSTRGARVRDWRKVV